MSGSLSAKLSLAIIDHCPLPVLVLDNEGRVNCYNQAFERLVGGERASALRGQDFSTLSGHPARDLLGLDDTVLLSDQTGHHRQFEIHRVDIPEENQFQARFYVDISKQVELKLAHETLNKELKQHVLTDSVTGLLNQRGILLALEPQVARSRRYNSPISVIMVSMDMNDEKEGALILIAQLLKDQLRWADLVGCNDNHEFILVLPETSSEAASRLGAKLAQQIHKVILESSAHKDTTVVYGVADWRKSDTATTLVNRASIALSQARSERDDHSAAV